MGERTLTRMGRWTLIGWVACALSFVASSVHAQGAAGEEKARVLFEQAQRLNQDGYKRQAAARFEQAFELAPYAFIKFNAALLWHESGNRPLAAEAYELALRIAKHDVGEAGALKPGNREAAEVALAELREALGMVKFVQPAGARFSVAHAKSRPSPATAYLEPGRYDVTVAFEDGSQRTVPLVIEAGETVALNITRNDTEMRPPPPRLPPTPPEGMWMTPVGWTLMGVGGAGGIVTLVLGVMTLDRLSAFKEGGLRDMALHDETITLRAATNFVGFPSLTIGVIGLVMAVVAPSDEEELSIGPVSLSLSPIGTSARLDF